MFDPEELDAKIARSHINAEKVEAEAQGLESKLLENYEFKKHDSFKKIGSTF